MSHQPDERLELYALGRLSESDVAIVEEHLLICVSCQERLDEVELFAMAMRQAITSEPAAQSRQAWWGWLMPSWGSPWAFAGAPAVLVALALATVLYLHPDRNVPSRTSVDLAAMRGDVPRVGLAKETDITLTDAPIQSGMRAEVVDSTGIAVWSEQLRAGSAQIKILRQLTPGSYFVRLFDQPGKLLHEYGLNVFSTPV